MKLEARKGRTSRRARELVGQPEQVEGSDFFDPRVELKEEFERLKREPQGDPARGSDPVQVLYDLQGASELATIDSDFQQVLREFPGFEEHMRGSLDRSLSMAAEEVMSVTHAVDAAVQGFQVFPELRPEFKEKLNSLYEGYRQALNRNNSVFIFLSNMCRAWPERRKELLKEFFPLGIGDWLDSHPLSGEIWMPEHKIDIAASAALLFPDRAEQFREWVRPSLPDIHEQLLRLRGVRRGSGDPRYTAYLKMIKDLTVLGSKRAWIDQVGQIQVELHPLTVRQPASLPARDEV